MPTVPLHRAAVAALSVAALAACSDDPIAPPDATPSATATIPAPTDPTGAAAFASACAGCHASGDGFDLAFFGFSDTTIVRRAVHHVDSATAWRIVAHVRSLDVRPVGRDTRPFQSPVASSDVDFAVRLFGRDAWPAALDEAGLLAIDPAGVALAVAFPVWSDEGSNLDWMPDAPLPPEVLGSAASAARRALAAYGARPTDANLVRAVQLLRRATRDTASGPCFQEDDGALRDPRVCFAAARWTASLGAQHLLRSGGDPGDRLAGSPAVPDAFWDVGQAARRSLLRNRDPVDHAEENWVSWMVLGWVAEPGNHASVYTSGGLDRVGLPRHATFVALRSMAARPPASPMAFADLSTAARLAPAPWLAGAYATGLSVLEARVERGWKPPEGEALSESKAALERAGMAVRVRLGARAAEPLLARTRALLDSL